MRFHRMQGCGNAFAIFDSRPGGVGASLTDAIVGAVDGVDQIISIEHSVRACAFMRIWNNDGSEVAACGNALRCVAWLLMRESGRDRIILETKAGLLPAERHGENEITVDMGCPSLHWREIPLSEAMDTRRLRLAVGDLSGPAAVNMGNPHVVFFVDDVESVNIGVIGPMMERHSLFPQKTNVGFAQMLAPDRIRLKIWERGVGETPACGTGACAAVVAACRRGAGSRVATVSMDGGALAIEWRHDDHVCMTGPITYVGEADLPLPAAGVS